MISIVRGAEEAGGSVDHLDETDHAVAGVRSFSACPSPPRRRAFSISLSFAEDRTPARSIRSSRETGQPCVRGKARTREREPQHPFKGQSFHGAYCHFDAQAGDVDTRWSNDHHYPDPDASSPDSSTTGRRSSNSTHQTSPRCTCPPTQERRADAARPARAVETVRPPVDHRCVKTNDHAVAACHSVDPARWQEAFEGLMSRIAGRFTRVEPRRRARQLVLGLLPSRTLTSLAGERTPTACTSRGGPSGTPTGPRRCV